MSVGQRHLGRLADEAAGRIGAASTLWFEGASHVAADLHERATRLSGGLRELGVAPGDRVSILMANCPEVQVAYQAIWRAGAVTNPIIFLLPPDELRHIFSDAGVRAVLTTPEFLPNVRKAIDDLDAPPTVVCLGGAEDGIVPWSDLEAAAPADVVDRADDDLATLMYTGGTTGRAKGVALSHSNLWYCAKASEEHTRIDEESRVLVPLPLSHAYGQIVTLVGMHAVQPGFVALMRWFDPAGSLDLIEQHRLNRATVVPSMLQLWLTQSLEDRDLSSLAHVSCGASPLALDVAEAFMKRVPSATVHEGYGCTESGGVIAASPPGRARLGSVGLPLPGYEVVIRDDDGSDLPTGEVGEIAVRAPGVMQGYWNSPETTAATVRDGWLHTGDLGRLDEDGYLYVVDRKKDLIIRNGFNVFPRDVEDALLEHPAVALAGVVGRRDAEVGEEVVAFVSLAPGEAATPDELVTFAKERLGPYRYPREVRVLEQVPLTPVLKIDRKALRTLLEA